MNVEQKGFGFTTDLPSPPMSGEIGRGPYEAYWKEVKPGTVFLALSADPNEEEDGAYTKIQFRFFADGWAWFSESMISGVIKRYDGHILITYEKAPSK